MKSSLLAAVLLLPAATHQLPAQSADWQSVVWREPQVRYLLADMTLNGGKTELCRKYATGERDPDSIQAIRLWDAGARVVNTNDLERRWLTNKFGKVVITRKGSNERISGALVRLSSERPCNKAMRGKGMICFRRSIPCRPPSPNPLALIPLPTCP